MRTLYHSTLNGGKASDWMRPIPCQQEGDKPPKGQYQSGNGYSTGVHLPGHLACDPSSRREASHISSQGKEAVFVTHDIYIISSGYRDGLCYSDNLFTLSCICIRVIKPIILHICSPVRTVSL